MFYVTLLTIVNFKLLLMISKISSSWLPFTPIWHSFMSDSFTANSVRLNIAKTHVVSYIRKRNFLCYEYQICHATITLTNRIKDLGVFFHSTLHFHIHAYCVFSECNKLLDLIRSITYRFPSLECLYVLYFTIVKYKLEYATVVWNSLTSTWDHAAEICVSLLLSFVFFHLCSIYLYLYLFCGCNWPCSCWLGT
jgi:hypothetical protein